MSAPRVRVILVDDHAMVLDAMTATLGQRDEIEIAGTALSHREAVSMLSMRSADVLVTDFELGDGRGTELVAYATRLHPPVPVLLITGTDGRTGLQAALDMGCAGFVSKSEGFDQLVDAVLAIAKGAPVFPASAIASAAGQRPSADQALSSRDLEVLQHVADARSVAEISDQMHLPEATIEHHIRQILELLGARSQLEAVVIAARAGHIEIR